jgi:OPA family glycerol-3-phosphate transporter-like MFS transporter
LLLQTAPGAISLARIGAEEFSIMLTSKTLKASILCLVLLLGSSSPGFSQEDSPADPAAVTAAGEVADDDDSARKEATGEPRGQDSSAASTTPVAPTPPAPEASADQPKKAKKVKKSFLEKFAPILILLIVVAFVLGRLPQVEGVNHTSEFRRRRVLNWLPLGLTYAFLYMGRYNIKVSQHAFGDKNLAGGDLTKDLVAKCTAEGSSLAEALCTPMMTNPDFAFIFMVGTWVYGCSFLINGPMVDRLGGKFGILMGAGGAAVANLIMGLITWYALSASGDSQWVRDDFRYLMAGLYGINMYFQSFGAVAIVKVNAPWFHIRERGVFGAIFGVLISLGIYLAFDVGYMIIGALPIQMVFLIPTVLLAVFWLLDYFIVRNTPGQAGFEDFDLGDASGSLEQDGERLGAMQVFGLMLKNPVIITIACIEFCSGFLRQAIMQWYRTFAKQTDAVLGLKGDFVYENWGMLLCCAGILGGVCAGILSDRVFQSRRGPVAAILYGVMLLGGVTLVFTYQTPYIGIVVIVMSMAVIGVHGMLSGTASMDFGGKQNVGTAVGIIDGFVYAGTGVMAMVYMFILPDDSNPLVAGNPDEWIWWPVSMIPVALVGLVLATRVWNAKPKGKSAK